uniref:Si:ch211-193l2.10 n=1 Tax=Oryzias melastigma TaxID=30732 RepID=A0A3B3C7E1_ORYME
MRGLLTTQSQNCYKEQIQKEMLTRLAWKSRYAKLYPFESIKKFLEFIHVQSFYVKHIRKTKADGTDNLLNCFKVRTKTNMAAVFNMSFYLKGNGRSLHLQRRGHIRPEEKFNFPLLSSWEYGWRLGDYTLDYRTPSHARSAVVEKTFYSKNGVLRNPTATDSMS